MKVTLHSGGQYKVATDKHRFKIICAGRRWGKSTLSRMIVLGWAVKNPGLYFIVSPTYRQSKMIHWRDFQNEIPKEWIAKKNESELSFTLKNGSIIELKGAENPDALRGVKLRGLVIDEIASIRNWEWLWSEVLRPTLTDYEAPAIFISCVTKDTLILGENGLEKIGICPNGHTKDSKQLYGLGGWHEAVQRYGSGKCPTLKIKTKFGFEIECTHNHKLWTLDGWKRTDEFKMGDHLRLQYGQQVFGQRDNLSDFNQWFGGLGYRKLKRFNGDIALTKDIAYLLGLYLAEGNSTNTYVDISNIDPNIIEFLERMGFSKNTQEGHYRLSSVKWAKLIAWFNFGRGARNKVIPQKVLEFKKPYLVEFIKGYFDGDGTTHKNRPRVNCTTTSEELSRQLQILLLNFGVLSKRRKYIAQPTKLVKVSSRQWVLSITNYAYKRFYEEIGFRLKRKGQKIIVSDKNTYKVSFNRGDFGKLNAKYGYLGREKKIETHTLGGVLKLRPNSKYSSNFLCDEVKEIIESEADVYDFVIPETHSYFTNGFISHNTPKGYNHFHRLYEQGQIDDNDYQSWRFTSYDNPFIPKKELDNAKAELMEDTFAQEYMADFRKYTGLVYKGFDRGVHVIKPFDIPFDYEIVRGFDFGSTNPTVCVWIAIDGDDNWYIVNEHYETGQIIDYHAGKINSNPLSKRAFASYGDPSGAQWIQEFADRGVYITPATKERSTNMKSWVNLGIEKIGEKLKPIPGHAVPLVYNQCGDDRYGEKGMFKMPRLYVFDSCGNTIKEFETYKWREKKVTQAQDLNEPDVPEKANDHVCDAVRYVVCSHQGRSEPNPIVADKEQRPEANPNRNVLPQGGGASELF